MDALEQLRHQEADLQTVVSEAEGEERAAAEQQLREVQGEIAALEAVTAPETEGAEEAEDFRPAPSELVVANPGEEHEVFLVLDRHDEDLIVQELQRRVVKTMLYDFPQDGTRVVDLSIYGARECIRLMNRTGKCSIRIVPGMLHVEETIEDGAPWVTATVYAEDAKTGQGNYGTASQPKRMKLKAATAARYRRDGKPIADDDTVWDKFARSKALSKAERNALKGLIPEPLRQTLIAQYTGDAERIKVIQAGAGAQAVAELPPPLTDDEAVALVAQARAVYEEIREHDKLKVLPAQFNASLQRAEHSHERLRDFIAMLEQKRDEAKAAA